MSLWCQDTGNHSQNNDKGQNDVFLEKMETKGVETTGAYKVDSTVTVTEDLVSQTS